MILNAILIIILAHLVLGLILWLRVRKICSFPGFLGIPVIGNLFYFYKTLFFFTGDSLLKHFIQVTEKYGKNGFCLHVAYGYKITAIISNPDLIKKILFHPNLADKNHELYGGFLNFLKGPFSRPRSDDKWKMWRKEYNMFLKRSCIDNNYFETLVKAADKQVDMLLESCDPHIASMSLSQNVTMKTLYGIETDLVFNPQIAKSLTRFFDLAGMVGVNTTIARILAPLLRTVGEVAFKKELELRKVTFEKIDKTLVSKKEPLSEPSLAMHVAARSIQSNVSEFILRKEMLEIYFTAAHTVASALSNIIYFFAILPNMQDRAWKEQCEIFGNEKREPTIDDLERMQFLDRFIKESLRFLGPSVSGRKATADINVDGISIPNGAIVIYLSKYIRFDSKYWKNPNVFDPDRFLVESDLLKYTFTPFGLGVRSCPGRYFAMTIMKITLSKILRRLKLRTADKNFRFESIKYRTNLLTEVTNHPRLNIVERT